MPSLAIVVGADPRDQQVAELVLAGTGEGQAGGDRARVAVVRVVVADRQQLDVVLAGDEAGRRRAGVGDDGGVLALQSEAGTSVPGDLHRCRMSARERRIAGDSTSPGARPMTPGLEGGRVEAETRVDLYLARQSLRAPSKPRACRTLRNLNLHRAAQEAMAECADVSCWAPRHRARRCPRRRRRRRRRSEPRRQRRHRLRAVTVRQLAAIDR